MGTTEKEKHAIPESTISRLSLYLRQLDQLEKQRVSTIRSTELAFQTGITAAQLRKDLAYFGQFGVRGQGYSVSSLKKKISQTLGINQTWKTVIIGAGNLGQALSSYRGFLKEGFHIVALFDVDPKKLHKKKGKLPVLPFADFVKFAKKEKISIALLAVPAEAAKEAFTLVTKAGIRSVLNFAPVDLAPPQRSPHPKRRPRHRTHHPSLLLAILNDLKIELS